MLPRLGGQTALNLALALDERGVLEKYGVELHRRQRRGHQEGRGSRAVQGSDGEDRASLPARLRRAHARRGLRGGRGHRLSGDPAALASRWAARAAASPTRRREFDTAIRWAFQQSPTHECLVEESVLGWKEYELEVIRDRADNFSVDLHDRELRPDGRAHGRLDHRGARDDADR